MFSKFASLVLLHLLATVASVSASSDKTVGAVSTPFAFRPFTEPGIIGYWANWGTTTQPENTIDKLDLRGVSAVLYAFVFPTATGGLIPFWNNILNPDGSLGIKSGEEDDKKWIPIMNGAVRNKYPKMRTVVSIGGWSGSTNFSAIAASPEITNTFVKNVHTYLDTHGFDGVDLDWEYPGGGNGIECLVSSSNDIANYVNLLKALRAELGPYRHISIAVDAFSSMYTVGGVNYAPQYAKYVSYMGLMTYDIYGSWNSYSDFNSPLGSPGPKDPQDPNWGPMNIPAFAETYTSLNISKSKLVTGLAFYGRSMQVLAKGANNGIYEACNSAANAVAAPGAATPCDSVYGDYLDALAPTLCDTCGAQACNVLSGEWMYYSVRGGHGRQPDAPLAHGPKGATNKWTYKYFPFASSATVFTPQYRNYSNYVLAFDDVASIKAKASWARKNGLAGQIIWELSSDYEGELLSAAKPQMPSSSSEKKAPHREMELDLEKPSTLKELRIEDVLIESVLADRSTQQQIANIVTAFNTKAEGTGITFNDVIVQSWLRGRRVAAGDWFICHKNQVPFISASCQQKLAPHINFSMANTIARVNDRRYSVNDLIISVFGIHILNVPNMRYARGLIGTSNEPRLYGTGVHVIHDSTFSLADPPTVLSSEEYINHGSIHLVRIRPGCLAKIWIGVQAVLLPFKVEPYVFNDPLFRFDATISENEALISHGNQHIIRVPSGQVAKIWVNGEAVVLEARSDAYLFNTPYFSTAKKPWMVMATDSVIEHGSIKRLVPATGQVGVCYDAGKLAIVRPSDDGTPFIRDSPLFRFDDFLNINIATVVFPSERVKAERRRENSKANTDELNYEIVTTRDSLKVGVKLMMTYRIDNPELLLSVLSLTEIPNHIEQVCSTDLSRAIQQTTSQEFLSFNTSN
ncbi:hypothetical protein HDU98_001059, partial [Podochytrium sp. JEL0797]